MAQKTREILLATADDYFPIQGQFTEAHFVERLNRYEKVAASLVPHHMLMGRWVANDQIEALTLPLRRLSDRLGFTAGSTALIASRWYPVLLLFYSSGIGAITGKNYWALKNIFSSPAPSESTRKPNDLLIASFDRTGEIINAFKIIPGRERQYVARSEQIFSFLQPFADDYLFSGREYEGLLIALNCLLR